MIRRPGRVFALSAAATAATLLAWGVYLAGHRVAVLAPYLLAVAALFGTSLSAEEPAPAAVTGPGWGPRWAAGAVAILAAGLVYRVVTWPALLHAGDSADYATMASSAAATGRAVVLPWRTPGYTLPLTWIERLAGAGDQVAIHAWQIVLSLVTAVLVMAVAHRVTRSRPLALLALGVASLAWPMAVASAYLMTEVQAMLLTTLAVLLVLAVHDGRHAGAAALALGPVTALGYETRPALLPWMVVAGAAALLGPRLRWRQRGVLVAGAVLTLAPVAAINAASPFHVVTPGPAVDLVSENLGADRFSLYWTAPNSPALLDQLYDAIVADGAETDYWLTRPAAQVAALTRQRGALMERSALAHAGSYVRLSLRRAPLLFRYDQPWDMTDGGRQELLLIDLLLALALVGAAGWAARRGGRPVAALLGGLVLAFTVPLALFHVEPRYSLPALPVVVVLAVMGVQAVLRQRAAAAAALALAVLLAVPASEAWLWPALANDYAPRPAMGAHEVAACYVGHQLLTSVAWQPGTSLIVAGGANGMATWDAGDRSCPWQPITEEDVWDLGFSRDGSRLAIGSYHARIVDARTWRPLPPPLRPGPLTGIGTETLSVSLDPAGDRLAFAATGLHAVGLYDVAGRGVVETVDLPASPTAVRWSPDGSTLAVAAADGLVRLYDASLRPLGQLPVARLPTALAWSPSGAALAVGDEGGRVALVDAGRPGHPVLAAAIAHEGAVRALAFSPDGRRLASAGSDDVARIWTADGLTPAMTLAGDTAGIWGVQWSPDSSRVVTASADGSLGLWSV